MTAQLPRPMIVSTPSQLSALAGQLRAESLIAVDTESNSLFAYRERVCLIQLSTRTADYLIDPLTIQDLSPLAPLFADPEIEKVFHAAEYDIMCLKRDYDFRFANLFDTMVAARITGRKAVGLANMLEAHFGVRANKRYQRADWSRRPIPPEQMAYAQQDTHYLPLLRDILCEELGQHRCLDEALEVFESLAALPAAAHSFDPEGYWSIAASNDLTRRQVAVLRELYLLRDQIARERDLPPFKIMGDGALVNIARAVPAHLDDLAHIQGLGHSHAARYGQAILRAVARGQAARLPSRPERTPRVDAATLARYNALRDWRKLRASQRGVESDVIIPKDVLWALARAAPRSPDELANIPGLGPWKRDRYGAELLALLASAEVTE